MWALDILREAGFLYDSSIFPIRHDMYGIPDAPHEPGRFDTPKGASDRRVSNVDGADAGIHAAGIRRRLFPASSVLVDRAGLRKLNDQLARPFIFYLHPWEVDPAQPRVQTGLKSRLRHYTNLHRTEARLQRLIGDFSFAPVREVLGIRKLLVEEPGGWRAANPDPATSTQ